MIFSDDVLIRVVGLVLGLCGFAVARHIYKHKNNNDKPLVCPVNFDCHGVVHSDYARFFGIQVEILGMLYYSFISAVYLFLIFIPTAVPTILIGILVAISFIAFLFSLYLIGVQIFALKKGCSWCIVSAIDCALIFILTISIYNFSYLVQLFVR